MKRLALAFFFVALASAAQAQEYKVGALVIDHPWTRATPKSASVAGGYVKITNTGSAPDRLIGGSVDVAKKYSTEDSGRFVNGILGSFQRRPPPDEPAAQEK